MEPNQHCHPELLLEMVGGDRDIFLQLVDIFKRESMEKLQAMRQAVEQGNLPQLAFNSHALKGTVGPLGVDALVEELVRIEDECNRGQAGCDAQKLAELAQQVEAIRLEVEHFVAHDL
jgi:HPt (histidine-containing phosphotransfer) domain-containing protein